MSPRSAVATMCWLLALAAAMPAQRTITVGGEPSVEAVLADAARYVREYQQALTYLVADEQYRQQIRGQVPLIKAMPRTRALKSEIFFMFAPDNRDWMAIRDVSEMDGRPIEGRPDLKTALQLLPASQVAGAFKSYNSRYNLGRISRNFNEPTLSLLVLDDRHRARFTFERRRTARTGDALVVTLGFSEQAEPTLIRDLNLQPVFSTGELVVEAGTGRIRRAVLRVTIGAVNMEFTTEYARDAGLDLWVPASFREQYEDGMLGMQAQSTPAARRNNLGTQSQYEEIICDATYTNYRRFEVLGRIKKLHY